MEPAETVVYSVSMQVSVSYTSVVWYSVVSAVVTSVTVTGILVTTSLVLRGMLEYSQMRVVVRICLPSINDSDYASGDSLQSGVWAVAGGCSVDKALNASSHGWKRSNDSDCGANRLNDSRCASINFCVGRSSCCLGDCDWAFGVDGGICLDSC